MSEIHVSPYVNFQGQAREAMEFYHQVLGGKLDLYTINAQGVSKPAEPGERITHARLEADGALILGSDGHPDYPATVGENIGLALVGTEKDRMTPLFTHLAEGGKIKMPLTAQPWGTDVGWLADKFGMNWMVTVEQA
jgi:PhnB protein